MLIDENYFDKLNKLINLNQIINFNNLKILLQLEIKLLYVALFIIL